MRLLKHEVAQSSIKDFSMEGERRSLALSYLIRNLFEAGSLERCLDVAIKGLSMLDFFQSQISLLEDGYFVVKRNHMDKKHQFLLERIWGRKFLGYKIDARTPFVAHLLNSKIVTTADIKDAVKVRLEDFIKQYVPHEGSARKSLSKITRVASILPKRIELLILPLNYQGKVIGALGISNPVLETEDVFFMQNVCELFAQAFERVQSREELEKGEEKIRSIFASSPDAITVIDLNGDISECNEATLDMLGYSSKEEIIGKNGFTLIAGKDRERAKQNLKKLLEQGSAKSNEYTALTKDGREFPAELSSSVVKDTSGAPIGFVAITKDITERKQMEEALERQRDIAITLSGARNLSEALNRLFDNLLEIEEFDCAGFYLVDEDTRALDMIVHRGLPRGFVEKVGHLDADTPYAKVVMEGKPIYQKTSDFPPVIREDLQSDGILAVAAIPILHKGEAIGNLNLASHTHVETSASTRHLLESVGAQIGETVVRARMEEELRKSESKSRTLLENLPQKIFFKDKNSVYISCNENYAKDLKIKSDEVRGKTDYDFHPKKLAEKYRADDKRIMASGKTEDIEEEYIQDGQKVLVHTVKTPVKDENGNVVGILGIFWDITQRKKAEEELIRLSSAVKTSTDSIVISDLDGKILDVNEATLKMYGTDDKGDLTGKSSFDLIAPEELEKALASMKETLEKGYTKNREYHVITKDGRRIPVEMSAAIMKDADGKPIGFVGISRDITERKQAEEALRESEERYRVLIESAADAIFTLNEAGDFLSANQEAARNMGKTPEDMIGKNMYDLFPKDVADRQMRNVKAVFQTGKPLLAHEALTQTEIGQRWYSTTLMPVRDSCGKTIYVMGSSRNITEHKKMEEKLRQYSEHLEELVQKRTQELLESEKRYSVLVEEASDGVVILQDGKIVFANKKAAPEIVGYSRNELIGMPFEKLVDEKHLKLVIGRYERRMRGEKVPAIYEIELIAKNGEHVPIEISATLIRYQGRPADLIILRDIRERKQMEEEHLKLEKLATIGELATMVGHDLRNPLQSIENATYYLNNELTRFPPSVPIPQKTIEMLQVLNDSVNYADKVIRDLQDFSATKKPTLEKTNINAIIKETLSQAEAPKNVKLITDLGRLPEIEVDKGMIKRTFLNLTINGIQAMDRAGTLKVSTKKTKGFVEISFKDTGTGISEENMKKIFTPFFTTKAKGMGMGLAICKRFIESHAGSIKVESKEGKGSTFTVKLPIQHDNGGEKSD